MIEMILGLVLFIGMHLVTARRDLRAQLISLSSDSVYKIAYSLVSLIGLVLVSRGYGSYRAAGFIHVWSPPSGMRHLTIALMLPAVIMVVASYLRGRIYTTLKHPMLAGVKLWALAHLLSNGDLGGIILFGSILAWAVVDRISLKRRTDAGAPPIPVGGVKNDALAVAVGIVVFLALGFTFHPVVIGVPVFGV